ncbi:MAG: citrate/2-methylcitrate synthase, partial [Acutalibacteraceae bacterium]
MKKRNYAEITPEIEGYSAIYREKGNIDPELYKKYNVNRGLRDLHGKGVLTGLTKISEVNAKKIVNGEEIPCEGTLYYRGYNIEDLVSGIIKDGRFGFEEIIYLLLFGDLPDSNTLENFNHTLAGYRSLPSSFIRDIIMKAPSSNMMNSLARSVLTLYSYDSNPDDTSIENALRQCIQLIAV